MCFSFTDDGEEMQEKLDFTYNTTQPYNIEFGQTKSQAQTRGKWKNPTDNRKHFTELYWKIQIPGTHTLREESSQTNVILQYKLLAAILSAVCSVIEQSYYVLHFYYTRL